MLNTLLDEEDGISRNVDKLVKRLRVKIDRLGIFGLKSTINKGRTAAIRHMKSRVENMLGGKTHTVEGILCTVRKNQKY